MACAASSITGIPERLASDRIGSRSALRPKRWTGRIARVRGVIACSIKLTSMFGLRFDVRQATTPKPFGLPLASGWLRENEISAGFGLMF